MYVEDTITAIATASGVSSIAIIRISGVNSLEIAKKISKIQNFKVRYAHLTHIYSNDEIIDEAIIIYFKAPYSFTGEDVIEIQCHGGIVVADMILNEVLKAGARLAQNGEFSKRAFLNNKIDLTKAEAISKLIEAKSIDSAKILAKHLKGDLKNFVEEIRESLLLIIAFVEVNIDYADEDLDENIYNDISEKLNSLSEKLKNTLEASKRREGLFSGFKVSIIGKPNVGKSSILNRLLNYERAIVSAIAGTTRDTIEESIKIGTHLIKIVDTAGIRESSNEIESIGITRSIEAIKESEIVVAIFEVSREFDSEDRKILEIIDNFRDEKEIIIIINKTDLKAKFELNNLSSFEIINLTKENINPLIEKLETILNTFSCGDELILTSKRQIEAIEQTLKTIENSKLPFEDGELELFAFELNSAIKSISEISKPIEYSEILDKIFGSFCLGK